MLTTFFTHVLIATALSVVGVLLPLGQLLFPILWIIVVTIACYHKSTRGRLLPTLATYVVITSVIVVGAVLAPVKTTERFLDRPMVLPKTEFMLGELDRENHFDDLLWLPNSLTVEISPSMAAKQVRFTATHITYREFVKTLEAQSDLRHRFHHCGNGSSILFGGDCSFGMALRQPSR